MIHSPNDDRVDVDVKKIQHNFLRVYYNYGCIVKGIGQNNGIRYVKNVELLNSKIITSVQNEILQYKIRSKEKEYEMPELTALGEEGLLKMIDFTSNKFEQ